MILRPVASERAVVEEQLDHVLPGPAVGEAAAVDGRPAGPPQCAGVADLSA